ncbi:unnamed protein product, partial [Candidula unifasciata]
VDSLGPALNMAPGDPDRGTWGGKMEFLMTCIGYAVGLGNVWRFPYLCYKNGGGAFLIPYILMLILVGMPLFFMELAFGQFASLGPITVWRINPLFKESRTDSVLNYMAATGLANRNIPETYNTSSNTSTLLTSIIKNNGIISLSERVSTPAEEYYSNYVLQKSSSIEEFGTLNWRLALCLLLSWIVVGGALIKGVQSLGKVVYFTAIFPYIMLTVLLIRGVTLDGAVDGIIYYVKPDFNRLADPRRCSDTDFLLLSACSGGLIAMSSFNKFTNILNSSTSIFAGFVIFSILGFMAHEKGVDVSAVAKGGPGLAFEVYPEALSRMVVAPLWAVFFFLMMATLGFGSQFSIVECVMSALLDEFPRITRSVKTMITFRLSVVVIGFGLGLPMLVDYSVGGFPLLIVGIVECIAINWIYGFKNFWRDIEMMIGNTHKIYWKTCWTVVSPLVILITIIVNAVFYKEPTYNGLPYPQWANILGWLIVMFPISAILLWFCYYYCKKGGFR